LVVSIDLRDKGRSTLKDGEIMNSVTIPALRNDLTQELFREITRQVSHPHLILIVLV
jgi:hypothetical protein